MMKKGWWLVVSALALVADAANSQAQTVTLSGAEPGSTPPAATSVIDFDPGLGQLPESIAVDAAGNLYVSMGPSVFQIDAERQLSLLVTLPIDPAAFATGVKLGPDGFLYVASAGFDPALDASGVWKVSRDTGSVALVAALDAAGFPNDIAIDDDLNLYVTDPFLGLIWRIDAAGVASEWLADPALEGNPSAPALVLNAFGADGIAFDRRKRHLYVSNLDFGTILRIRLRRDGSPGRVVTFASDPLLVGADGIAFDRGGTLFVAVNARDRIATVDRGGGVTVLLEGAPLDGPSSLAFGARRGERRTLFFTNFAIGRATGVTPGVPQPGVMSIAVERRGLPLP
jgi:sugar lactone lactonase YvrE